MTPRSTPRFDVDLDALDANLAVVGATVMPAATMLIVKDDAYGHGIAAVVPRALARGVRWIGAFDVPTARAVRDAVAGDVRVFVWMLPSSDDIAEALALDLELGVGDAELLDDVARVARDRATPARVHLKIDTGLHRNGFRPEDWGAAVARARQLEREGAIRVVGVWSHIAEASDRDDDDARAAFDVALAQTHRAGLTPELRHLAASSASFARPEFRYDLVRVGAFAYGVPPAGGPTAEALGIRPVGRLVGTVTAIDGDDAQIDMGSLHGVPSTLGGLISVGTGDGPRRLLSVGLTQSRIDGRALAPGDEVVVFGGGAGGAENATALAERIGTIGEEIVTRVSPRVPRNTLP